MPFPPGHLSDLIADLKDFVIGHDFVDYYKKYHWRRDTWSSGFPDILECEIVTGRAVKNGLLAIEHVKRICVWGGHRNLQSVECTESLSLQRYENQKLSEMIEDDPCFALQILRENTKGLGPTFLSKVLRFALPSEFGAIDSQIVRVMGNGDPESKRQNRLTLTARNYGSGWSIREARWPAEYATWINILRFFADSLNVSGMPCPHREDFVTNGLRKPGYWICAEVEMALFSYASRCVKNS